MGLEFLDLGFQLEKIHHITINWDELSKLGLKISPTGEKQWDMRVDDFRAHLNTLAAQKCTCGYLLHGLPPTGNCPECGKPYPGGISHEQLARLIATVTATSAKQITGDLWLRKDLDMG